MRIDSAQNMTEPIFKETFFPAENDRNMPEITVFADFYCTFTVFLCFFIQNIINFVFQSYENACYRLPYMVIYDHFSPVGGCILSIAIELGPPTIGATRKVSL